MRRIKGAAWQIINDDDVAGWLAAECDSPFDLIRVANIDVGIDHHDQLGTLTAGDRRQDSVTCLSGITLLHRHDDVECNAAGGWYREAGECRVLRLQHGEV